MARLPAACRRGAARRRGGRTRIRRPARRSAWYSGANTTSPMPALIFQKMAPLYSKNSRGRQEQHQAGAEPGPLGIGVLVSRTPGRTGRAPTGAGAAGMGTVADDPLAEVLVVEPGEAGGVVHEPLGDDAPDLGQHHRHQVPHPPVAVGVALERPEQRAPDLPEGGVHHPHRRRCRHCPGRRAPGRRGPAQGGEGGRARPRASTPAPIAAAPSRDPAGSGTRWGWGDAVIEVVGASTSGRIERAKSPRSRRARRTRSAPVKDPDDASSSPGLRSLVAKSPSQWCQRSPSKSSKPTRLAGRRAASTVAIGQSGSVRAGPARRRARAAGGRRCRSTPATRAARAPRSACGHRGGSRPCPPGGRRAGRR